MLTYHEPDKPTIHIMPGFPALLAVVFYFLEMEVKVFCSKINYYPIRGT